MHPKVRDLYKRFLLVGRAYPQGLAYVRCRVKEAFRSTALPFASSPFLASSSFEKTSQSEENDVALNKALAKGRYWVRELQAISSLHKYRQMNKRYGRDNE